MPPHKRSRARWEELHRELLANAPVCACGCERQVLLRSGDSVDTFIRQRGIRRYNRYLGGHQTRPVNWKVELDPDEREAILGTLLGDSSISTPPGGKHPRLTAGHSGRQAQWAEHKAGVLARLGMKAREKPDARYTGGTKIALATPCLPCLEAIRVLVAPAGAKRITRGWLDSLGGLGLAWWIGDDGSSGGRSFTIATHGFPREDVELAAAWFRDTYGPVTVGSSRGHSWLYVSAAARRELLPLVEPHLPECMQYKLQAFRTREYRLWDLASALGTVIKLVEKLGLDRYPTENEFAAAGLTGLHDTIWRRFGGHATMACRLGLPRRYRSEARETGTVS
jgi:hypothetical protein